MKTEKRLEAIRLREQGHPLTSIMAQLGLGKSTVSRWVSHVIPPEDLRSKLDKRKNRPKKPKVSRHRIHGPVKYHGGKYFLCRWIISHFVDHKTYVEPFGGAASVLLNKQPCEIEIYNDLEPGISNLMSIIKLDYEKFLEAVQKIPCSPESWQSVKSQLVTDKFDQAIQTYVVKRMSRGGIGQNFSRSSRLMGEGVPEEIYGWHRSHQELALIAARLAKVEIRCQAALDVMREFDSEDTLFYLDPPYLPDTRSWKKSYIMEMSVEDHMELSRFCQTAKSKIIISGYPSDVYDLAYQGWKKEIKEIPNCSSHARHKDIKSECLWMNF